MSFDIKFYKFPFHSIENLLEEKGDLLELVFSTFKHDEALIIKKILNFMLQFVVVIGIIPNNLIKLGI